MMAPHSRPSSAGPPAKIVVCVVPSCKGLRSSAAHPLGRAQQSQSREGRSRVLWLEDSVLRCPSFLHRKPVLLRSGRQPQPAGSSQTGPELQVAAQLPRGRGNHSSSSQRLLARAAVSQLTLPGSPATVVLLRSGSQSHQTRPGAEQARARAQDEKWFGDSTGPFFGFMGAAAALVFSCAPLVCVCVCVFCACCPVLSLTLVVSC